MEKQRPLPEPEGDDTEPVYLSECGDTILNKLYHEPDVFSTELEQYQENLLHILMDLISREITRLTKKQREVLIRFFFRGESLRSLARKFNRAFPTIQEIKNSALKVLKQRLAQNPYFLEALARYRENDPTIAEILKFFKK